MATLVSVTGVSANVLKGSFTGGWGTDVYGRDGWNQPSSNAGEVAGEFGVNVDATGVATVGAIGSATQLLDMSVFPTGVATNGETPETTQTTIDGSTGNDLTGVSADVVLGDETVIFDSIAEVTGVSASGLTGVFAGGWGRLGWGDDLWGQTVSAGKVQLGNIVELAGVSASGSLGSVSLIIPNDISLAGVESSVGLSSSTVVVNARVTIVEAGGWGSGGWNSSVWGGVGDSLTINTNVGDVTNVISGTVTVTGVEAVSLLGDIDASPQTFISVTGVQSDVDEGGIVFSENVSLSGVEADTILGNVANNFDIQVPVTGVGATVQSGSVQISDATAETTGVSTTLNVGNLGATGDAIVPIQVDAGWGRKAWGDGSWSQPVGNSTPAISTSVGSVTASLPKSVSVNGVASVGFIGEAIGANPNRVLVNGVEAIAENGTIKLYIQINDGQIPDYQEVNSSQTPDYGPVNSSQTVSYQQVSTSQTQNYTEISTSQTPDYEELAA